MCGIVLAGGNLTGSDLEIFNQLLYCDVFRGQHSTGVFCKRPNEQKVSFYKEALPSYAYLLQPEYKELSTGKTNYTVAPHWLVGHNRHATRGAVNAQNAHPFQHGNITLVHNGTLVDQSHLPEHSRFVVDSENICYSIDKIGAEETIQKLDGAFTLIWHDAGDDTLHIIRNDERPFHLARCNQDWFGASEEDMLMWILKRAKFHKSRISEHFECKVGVEYIFDVSGKKMTLKEEKEHKLPVFTLATRWGRSSSWMDQYYQDERYERHSSGNAVNRGATVGNHSSASRAVENRRKEEIVKQNKIAADRGISIRRDQEIEFTPCMFTEYSGQYSVGKGKMTGYIYEDGVGEYIEVDVHNILQKDYELAMNNPKVAYKATVQCIHETSTMIRVVVGSGKWVNLPVGVLSEPEGTTSDQFDDDIPFDMNGTCVTGAGITVTRKFWESHAHGECGGCGKHIDWKDAPKALFAYQSYWHPDCLKNIAKEDQEENELVICSVCSKVVKPEQIDTDMSSYRKDDVCKACADEVREKIKQSKIVDGVWAKVVDLTTPRHNEISLRITPAMLGKMIIMGESTDNAIKMEDVSDCYIERRVGGYLAIAKLPEGCKTPKDVELLKKRKEEQAAKQAETFRKEPSEYTVRKVVKSIDGTRELPVTKAIWTTVGFCEYCYAAIPWKDVESCTLGSYKRIVCPKDKCRGKLNGSQKNPT